MANTREIENFLKQHSGSPVQTNSPKMTPPDRSGNPISENPEFDGSTPEMQEQIAAFEKQAKLLADADALKKEFADIRQQISDEQAEFFGNSNTRPRR